MNNNWGILFFVYFYILIFNIFRVYIQLLSNYQRPSAIYFLEQVPYFKIDSSVIFIELQTWLDYQFRIIFRLFFQNFRVLTSKERIVINWAWWQNSNIFILTENYFVFLFLSDVWGIRYFVGDKTLPLEKPFARYHEPHLFLVIFLFLIFVFVLQVFIEYKLFLHFSSSIQKVQFLIRNILRIMYYILKHLQRSKYLTFFAKYNLFLQLLFT